MILILVGASAGFSQDIFKGSFYDVDLILKHADEIQLNVKQAEEIKMIYQSGHGLFTEKKQELAKIEKRVKEKLGGAEIEKEEAVELLDHMLTLENEIKRLKLSTLIDIKNTLTEEQQSMLDTYNHREPRFESELLFSDEYKVLFSDNNVFGYGAAPLIFLKSGNEMIKVARSQLGRINPNDIEAIEVFKKPAAADQFGTDGKNGVLVIAIPRNVLITMKPYSIED
jgi:hypothetical protein